MTLTKRTLGATLASAMAMTPALADDNNPLSFNLGDDSSLTFYGYI